MKTFTRLIVLFLLAGNASLVSADSVDPDSSSTNSSSKSVPLNPVNQKGELPLGLRGKKEIKSTRESKYKRWTKLKYSGYIRSYNQFRHMPVGYLSQENLITINGLDVTNNGTVYTGYQEPLFLLRLEGKPTSKTSFKVEYYFDHQMFGTFNEDTYNLGLGPSSTANRRASVYRIFEFTGKANTKYGTFKLTAGGGVIWQRLSPFTYWNYEYRDHMFERYPWEPEGNPWSRYNQFYAHQNISRDARWGNTGTQGFVLEGTGLPLGINFTAIYGKTDNSGSFQTFLTRTPKNVVAGKIEKVLGKHKIGVNYFNQFGFTDGRAHRLYYDRDSIEAGVSDLYSPTLYPDTLLTSMFRVRQQIATIDARLNFDGVRIYAEAGVGRYQDSLIERFSGHNDSLNSYLENEVGMNQSGKYFVKGLNYGWGHAVNFQIDFDKALTRVPFGLQFFSVTPNVVNINSAVLNTANPNALSTLENVGTASDITTFQGATTELYNSQMANNRWGIRLKHEDSYGKLKVSAGIDMQQEHDNIFNTVTFLHQANAFTRSRFGYFQQFVGPYQRVVNIFRRTFEKVNITDTVVDYKKSYNSLMLSLKYKFLLLNKELIVSSFSNYNSVQDNLRPVPEFSDDAFIRTFYQEFLGFYAIHPRLTILGLAAVERNLGNDRTQLTNEQGELIAGPDPNGKPLNQFGYAYGLGFDYDLSSRAGLYVRQRWFHFKDVNQIKDRFYGYETTVELKIFF